VNFGTTAVALSSPGSYPISAALAGPGSGNYVVALGPGSGHLQIDRAASLTAESALAQNSYVGLPLVLTANVASTTQGIPTGTVSFSEGTNVVASASLEGGTASAIYLAPAAGSHTIVATYSGDKNFSPSSSQSSTTTVSAMPDFTVTASGGSTQTVTAGGSVAYTIVVAAQPAPFTGGVSLSASGLPVGSVVTFSPTQTVPGAGSATVVMSVQTAANSTKAGGSGRWFWAALLLLPWWIRDGRRRSRLGAAAGSVVMLALGCAVGCGSRNISTVASPEVSYALKVIGTGTNLAGAVVTHSATVTLIVQ
jgi:hypothetical protein